MSPLEQITTSLNDHRDSYEYMRKLATANQMAYRAFLQFYRDYCPSTSPNLVQQQHPDAQSLSASITRNSREVIALWQTGTSATDIDTMYQLYVHDLEAGRTDPYIVTEKAVLDTKNGDFRQYVGDATAIQLKARKNDGSTCDNTVELLLTNRGSLWNSCAYSAAQTPADVRLLPYAVAHQLRSPMSIHYCGQAALRNLTLLPDQLDQS